MEAMAERDYDELLGVDLVPRRSKNGIAHHTLPEFGGPVDGPEPEGIIEFESDKNDEGVVINSRSEGKEEEEGEVVNGDVSNGSFFGSETPNGCQYMLYSDHIVEDASIPRSFYPENNYKYSENEITNIFSTATSETSNEDHGFGINGTVVKPGNSAVLEELEVEKVLYKQETHDLFCPNCNSCITKRVILRPRKRKVQEISPSEENQEIVIPEPVQHPSPPETERTQEPIEETKRDAFECLSCFSIFIPIGRGFKLIFGGRDLRETNRDAPHLTTSDAPASVAEVENETELLPEQGVEPSLLPSTKKQDRRGFKLIFGGRDLRETNRDAPHLTTSDAPASVAEVENAETELLPEQGVEPSLLSSTEKQDSMAVHAEIKPQLPIVNSMALPREQTLPTKLDADVGNKLPDDYDNSGPDTEVQEKQVQVLIHNSEASAVPSTLDPQQELMGIEKKDTDVTAGEQVVVSVRKEPDEIVVSMTWPETEPLVQPTAVVPSGDGGSQLDIIKSIIYGGLLESIASLSVVTSAAGADAKTLNIVALGAANMFGGLFILAHNLRVLKHESSNERYEEVLGRPGQFRLHAVVAVIAYLVFGLIPPVVYGFSFRESDSRDYKLVAVASASLLCIILLALGKAHTRTCPRAYKRTLLYYVCLWVMVCGVSYLAGDLLDWLLQKLGLFESNTSVAVAVAVGGQLKASY